MFILLTSAVEIMFLLIGLFIVIDLFTGFKMVKSLFNRVKLKADIAAESLRDPEADAHAAIASIREKKQTMVNLRKQLLVAIRVAKNKQSQADAEVARYEQLAILAGQAKNVEDVKLALEKKANAKQKSEDAAKEVSKLTAQEDGLEAKIIEFDILIEKAEADKDFLASQLKINKFNTEMNTVLKSGGSALGAIDQLRSDVDASRIEAEVTGELSEESVGLEGKYKPASSVSADDIRKYLA